MFFWLVRARESLFFLANAIPDVSSSTPVITFSGDDKKEVKIYEAKHRPLVFILDLNIFTSLNGQKWAAKNVGDVFNQTLISETFHLFFLRFIIYFRKSRAHTHVHQPTNDCSQGHRAAKKKHSSRTRGKGNENGFQSCSAK